MLIDTHAHLDYPDFAGDFAAVLGRAREAGVTRIITIGTGLASSRRAVELAERHAGVVYAVVGVHPTNVAEEPADAVKHLREIAVHPAVVAIGETGFDYHHLPSEKLEPGPAAEAADQAYRRAQAECFEQHLSLAAELGMNVVVHQRDAWVDTLAAMAPFEGRVRGVFHCFGGTPAQAADVIARGHLVSFTGIVTFKNGVSVRETATAVPADGYMVETDCPYLAPVPFRGKRCEPAHTRLVAETIAAARGVSLDQIGAETSRTAERFFAFHRRTGDLR